MTEFEQVRVKLQTARASGADFDSAWPAATAGANGGMTALDATREAWRRAYERRPQSPAERAAGTLAGAELTGVDLDQLDWTDDRTPTLADRQRVAATRDSMLKF